MAEIVALFGDGGLRSLVATRDRSPRSEEIAVALEEYLAGLSAPTAAAYRGDLAHLERHLAARGSDLLGAERADLAAYVGAQEAAGVPATTIRRRLAAASGWFGYLVAEGRIERSPAEGIRRPRGGPAPRLGLDAAALAALRRVATDAGPAAELLVDLLLLQGLRISEAVGTDAGDVVVLGERRALSVRRKGGRREVVGLVPEVGELVGTVVAAQGPGPLLRGRGGGRLGRQGAARRLARLGEAAGIAGLHPHLLRHSYCTQALLAGVPLPVVAAGAGHRDLRTTLFYAQALAALAAEAGAAVAGRTGT